MDSVLDAMTMFPSRVKSPAWANSCFFTKHALIAGIFTCHDPTRGSGQESGGFRNLADQVGPGQEVFETSRDGSGHVRRISNLAGRDGVPRPGPTHGE